MNPTITIDDTDEEVIDLDSSQDAINVTDNEQSECSIKNHSSSNDDENKIGIIGATDENNINRPYTEICNDSNTLKPLFKVMFRNDSVARQYSKKVKEFLETLAKIKYQENDNGLTLEVWNSDNDSTSQSIELTTESEESQDIVCDTLFTVDTQPKLNDDFDVPTYGKKYEKVFDNSKPVETDSKLKNECIPRLMCYNCSEQHNLRDCPNPRDQAVIERNRKNFGPKNSFRNLRYHLEDNQKFGHMIPGQISNNLRKALGLKENELPKHIYRMRVLGYPPGWLEEAHLKHSGISLFNSHGLREDDPNDEPGAIYEEGHKDQYDIKKIYDFPGFNVPPPPGTRDEQGQYWVSRLQAIHSKQAMLSSLNGKTAAEGYKRKKLKTCNNVTSNSPAHEPTEMEIEDVEENVVENVLTNELFVPPSSQKPASPQTVCEDSDYHCQEISFSASPADNIAASSRVNSPSLTELENMKKQLLVELQESNVHSDVSSRRSSLNAVIKSDALPPNDHATPESNQSHKNEANTSRGSIKSVDLGTPVLQSKSPYNQLPSSEKFSKNICALLNFENLPDSTGKYEQMTGILSKVRSTLAKLHNE